MARMNVRVQGLSPKTLRPGETLKIGRRGDNDIILEFDSEVSRHHATLIWDADEDRPYVFDNASANGVLVDGEEIDRRHYLAKSCVVGIGGYEMHCDFEDEERVRGVGDGSEFNLGDSSGEFFMDKKRTPLSGLFSDNARLREVLLEMEQDRRSGTLFVALAGETAALTFAQGLLMQATYQQQMGLEALKSVVAMPMGTFKLEFLMKPSEEFLNLSMKEFLAG